MAIRFDVVRTINNPSLRVDGGLLRRLPIEVDEHFISHRIFFSFDHAFSVFSPSHRSTSRRNAPVPAAQKRGIAEDTDWKHCETQPFTNQTCTVTLNSHRFSRSHPSPCPLPKPSLHDFLGEVQIRKRMNQRLLTRQLPTPAFPLFLPLQEGDAGGPTYPCCLAPTESQTRVFRIYFTPAGICRFILFIVYVTSRMDERL